MLILFCLYVRWFSSSFYRRECNSGSQSFLLNGRWLQKSIRYNIQGVSPKRKYVWINIFPNSLVMQTKPVAFDYNFIFEDHHKATVFFYCVCVDYLQRVAIPSSRRSMIVHHCVNFLHYAIHVMLSRFLSYGHRVYIINRPSDWYGTRTV